MNNNTVQEILFVFQIICSYQYQLMNNNVIIVSRKSYVVKYLLLKLNYWFSNSDFT